MKNVVNTLFVGFALTVSSFVYADDRGDQYYVSCLLANTGLAPENQRFYCACRAASYEKSTVENESFLAKGDAKSACQATINPYYEALHQQKLITQNKVVDWAWL